MRLGLQMEQFLAREPWTTVRALANIFGLSREECMRELRAIAPFGVEITDDGMVLAHAS